MKLKKLVSLLLALIMTVLTFTACGEVAPEPSDSAEEAGVKLWWAYNTENFMQDLEYDYDRDSTLRMYGIKGDVESIQLMVTPDKDVLSYDFVMGDITSASGAVISADCFEIYAEHYMEVVSSYNPDSFFGYYPDALVPLENYQFRRYNSINAGKNQGIWLNVNIPSNAAAGTYTGEGTLTLDDETYQVPVELTVYNVTMPEEVHPASCFLIWYQYIPTGEGVSSAEMSDNYYWFLANKRVTPSSVDTSLFKSRADLVDYYAETLANNPKITNYTLPFDTDGNSVITRESCEQMLSLMVDKNIELRQSGDTETDLFAKAMYYTVDEPSGAEAYERVRLCDEVITQVKFEQAERLNDYPDLKESLLSLKHLITVHYTEALVGSDTEGGVQTWCPIFSEFNLESQRQNYIDRQNSTDRLMGENVWWYGCINPRVPYPTYHLDDHLITSRVVSWMQYDYDIEGNLYWCVNWYDSDTKGTRDLWTDPEAVGQTPGDGYLLYPGREFGINGPISTLRLESIRESHEDYEYFWLFEQKINEYNEANGTSLDADALLQTYFAGLYDGTIPATDSDAFGQQRIALLKDLEDLYTDLDSAVEKLTA